MGYQDGKNDIHSPPVDVQEVFITAYQEGYDSKRWEVVKGSFITRTRALTSTKNSLWNNAVKQEITSSDWRLKINGGFRKEAREERNRSAMAQDPPHHTKFVEK